MKEKITVGLFAEWDEEKGGWYVSTSCDFYNDEDILHLHESSLIEACDEWGSRLRPIGIDWGKCRTGYWWKGIRRN